MKPWISSPTLQKPGLEAHTCNHNTGEVEEKESKVQGHPQLHTYIQTDRYHKLRISNCNFKIICIYLHYNINISFSPFVSLPPNSKILLFHIHGLFFFNSYYTYIHTVCVCLCVRVHTHTWHTHACIIPKCLSAMLCLYGWQFGIGMFFPLQEKTIPLSVFLSFL